MLLKANQDFSWAHRGVRVEHYAAGQAFETEDEDLIKVSTKEGWAEKAKAPSKSEQKKALEEQIAELESKLVDASDADMPAIEASISETKAALAALG